VRRDPRKLAKMTARNEWSTTRNKLAARALGARANCSAEFFRDAHAQKAAIDQFASRRIVSWNAVCS